MKSNKWMLLLPILTLGLGFSIGKQWNAQTEKEQNENGSITTTAQKQLAKPLTKNEKVVMEENITELETQLVEIQKKNEELLAENKELKENKDTQRQNNRSRMEEMLKSRNQNSINNTLKSLQSAISLDENQKALVQSFLETQNQKLLDYRNSLAEGEFDWREYRAKENELLGSEALSNYLSQVLNPEQMQQYNEYNELRNIDRQESDAYREISQVLRVMPLNESQKDAIYNINFNQTYRLTEEDLNVYQLDPNDPEFNQKLRTAEEQRKLELYKQFLTEDQMNIYQSSSQFGRRRGFSR